MFVAGELCPVKLKGENNLYFLKKLLDKIWKEEYYKNRNYSYFKNQREHSKIRR